MVKKMLSKLLTFWIYLNYPRIPSAQRWFIRFRYFGLLRQVRYLMKDHIIKKPYKIIEFNGEFQQELLHVMPFAYWHHNNGTLLKTISTAHTKHLYYFSDCHEEKKGVIRNYMSNENVEIPNAPHDAKLLKYKWKSVPFKKRYKNGYLNFKKEILIIANRYNTEWNEQPISYFDQADLSKLFSLFKAKFQIIYNRPPASKITTDNSEVLELGERDFIIDKFSDVLILEDLENSFPIEIQSYNHLQLLVYANCDKFISIHGGTATLCSLFGGVNIIYSKKGHENYLNEFKNVFPELSGCRIFPYKNKQRLFEDAEAILLGNNS